MLGSWTVPFILWAIAANVQNGFLIALTLFVIIDRGHVMATWPMTFFDRATMREHGKWYINGFALVCAAGIACTWMGGLAFGIWLSIFIYWGAWHIVRQHYGFLRLYQARGARIDAATSTAEIQCLYTGCAAPYLYHLATTGQVAGPQLGLVIPPIPMAIVWLAMALFAVCALRVIVAISNRVRVGEDAGGLRLLYLGLALANFWVACLGPGRYSLPLAALFITSFHDLQYSSLVWYVLHKRYTAPDGERESPLAFLFRVRTPVLFAAMCGVGALAYIVVQGVAQDFLHLFMPANIPFGHEFSVAHSDAMRYLAALIFASIYSHYLFDSKMWQMRANPRLRAELGLGATQKT